MQVLKVTKRHSAASSKNPVSYIEVSIVLRAEDDEEIQWMQSLTKEYIVRRVIVDLEKYNEALHSRDIRNMSEHYVTGYDSNDTAMSRTSRKDIYKFHEYFTDCPSVNAIIGELEYIRDGGVPSQIRHTQYCHITSLIQALDIFWD